MAGISSFVAVRISIIFAPRVTPILHAIIYSSTAY
jgi:hypothetical protein